MINVYLRIYKLFIYYKYFFFIIFYFFHFLYKIFFHFLFFFLSFKYLILFIFVIKNNLYLFINKIFTCITAVLEAYNYIKDFYLIKSYKCKIQFNIYFLINIILLSIYNMYIYIYYILIY